MVMFMDREKLVMLIALSYFHLKRGMAGKRKVEVPPKAVRVLDPWTLTGRMEVVELI